MTDKERIEKEAITYVIYETGYSVLPEHDQWKKAFIAGAKSECNKVLDEAIAYLKSREKEEYDYFLNDSEDKHAYGKYCAFTEAAQELESLKL